MPLFPIDELEALLVLRARNHAPISYGEVFRWFGYPFQRFQVGQLSAALGEVDARQRAQGRPDLASLVVRASDGLPGQGWWLSLAEGRYRGSFTGRGAARFLKREQRAVFSFWDKAGEAPGPAANAPVLTGR